MNRIFLITGGNIGDRKKSLKVAAALVEKRIGKIIRSSKIYETDAWGIMNQPSFYNQVLIVESDFSANKAIQKILEIEKEMGRIRTIKNAARIIDIDILFFNNETVNKQNLIIPHPEIANRRFVLVALNELVPEMIHPVLKKSIADLLSICKDPLKVAPLTPL